MNRVRVTFGKYLKWTLSLEITRRLIYCWKSVKETNWVEAAKKAMRFE